MVERPHTITFELERSDPQESRGFVRAESDGDHEEITMRDQGWH